MEDGWDLDRAASVRAPETHQIVHVRGWAWAARHEHGPCVVLHQPAGTPQTRMHVTGSCCHPGLCCLLQVCSQNVLSERQTALSTASLTNSQGGCGTLQLQAAPAPSLLSPWTGLCTLEPAGKTTVRRWVLRGSRGAFTRCNSTCVRLQGSARLSAKLLSAWDETAC
jgi:hypothetical protein